MKKILLVLGLLLFPTLAQAQTNPRNPCYYLSPTSTNCQPVSPATPLPVLATVSASISGFTPNLSYATLTATATSASVALPTGTTIALQNTGTATVSCTLGVGSATATANQIQVPASSTVFVTPGSNTFAACIDQTGSTSNAVVLAGGTGLGAGFGGGGGGAGGSSAITTWGGATLGAATAWGVAPTGNVNGVNANIVAGSISVSNFPATQTVSGTVTANAGTNLNTSALALSANQTNGTQQSKITDGTSIAGVAPASTLPAATVPAMVVISRADDPLLTTASTCKAGTSPTTQTAVATGAVTSIQCDLNGNVYTRAASEYPTGAIPYTASATGTTAATAATLTGAASVTTYICGFSIRANATAAATANSTVAGTITGTLNYTQWTAPTASGLGITEQIFTPCIPASAANTSIVVTSAAPGTGGVVSVSAWGYKQ